MRYAIFVAIAIATLLFDSFIFIPEQYAASQSWSSPSVAAVINTAPIAVEDSYSPPGRFMPIFVAAPGVLANDNDVDGDQMTAQLVSSPSHGTVILRPDGSFEYHWSPGWAAADTFMYRASDGKDTSNTAIVTIQMFPNNPPIAVDDSYTIAPGQTLTVWPPGVLSNDTDGDGDRLLAHVVLFPQHGSLDFDIRGGFTYVPLVDFTGTDSFLYWADDGTAERSHTATVTINVTPAPTLQVQFSSATYSVTEGCVPAILTVSLLNTVPVAREQLSNDTPVTVDYVVSGGTASQKSDYTYAGGTLSESAQSAASKVQAGRLMFAQGEMSQPIQILVNEDGYAEGAETLQVTLFNPQGLVLGSPSTATLTISDNELVDAASNPIDEAGNFVCQQYHDFLHRQPDNEGLAFWTNQITQCGTDQSCIDEMRHNVAMAFFLSIEFQQRGYFVERLYEACLTRRPRYEEFIRDLHQVGLGVEVGAPGWGVLSEKNMRRFTEQFVQRTDFMLRYPTSMGAVAYVDQLFEYAGVEPSANERQAAIDAFGIGDTTGRAAAMRKTMESASVFRAYYNRAFVLVEYFGFLRREPNEAPDADWGGYDFWFRKMEALSLPGEDVTTEAGASARVKRAEMVRAFIVSSEYRGRFGKP